ncbi:hypothetical protein BH09ACT6_BH09ACT6_27340 [soil metagenome]
MAPEDSGWVGKTLADRYIVTARIGTGGMSTVYEALDVQLGRKVAVKLFSPGEARDDTRRRSEVDVLARLNHPNLVTMYDAHLASGDSTVPSFLVMELVNGPDLRSALDHGSLPGAVVAQITTDIAEGLAAMHVLGIVHRDLKPANILLVPTGLPSPTHRAKLADFGIAHLVGADRMTTAGTVIGTAAYLSPEQAAGAHPGPESDIYALGLVVLEGLTGRREYPGTVVEALSARASRDPAVPNGLPANWISLVTQMTARDPDARPSALDVAVRARHIAPELASWQGTTVDVGEDSPTVAMATPTRVMPDAATALQTARSAPSRTPSSPIAQPDATETVVSETATATATAPDRPKRKKKVALAIAGAALVVGAIWAGGALVPSSSSSTPAGPLSPPSRSGVSTTAPAGENSPQVIQTTAPAADATPTGGSGNGNNGTGNGNKGKGNGNGGKG